MKLIDKDKVEKILSKLWKEDDGHNAEHRICYNNALEEVQCMIDTLETKEVDFERDLSKYVSNGIHRFFPNVNDDYCKMDSVIWQDYVIETAKYFFNLGIKAQKGKEV